MAYTNIDLVNYVTALLNKPNDSVYGLGGLMRKLDQSWINRRVKLNDKYVIDNMSFYKGKIGKFVGDCGDIIKTMHMTNNKPFGTVKYDTKYDQNARMMYNGAKEKGTIKNGVHPDVLGLLVFTEDLGHVGVYVGVINGKKSYIEMTVTGGLKNGYKVLMSHGYPGKWYDWAKWAKYQHITYVDAKKPEDKPVGKVKEGDIVTIISNNKVQYATVNQDGKTKGKMNHSGKMYEVIKTDYGKPNPIRVKKVGSNLTSDIIGWFKLDQIVGAENKPVGKPAQIKVGDTVVPIKNVDYKGKKVTPYDRTYVVSDIDNRGAVLRAIRGTQRPLWAVLPLENIKKV